MNLNEIWISVIIPVYNVEKYLNQCVDSVLTQTFKNLENVSDVVEKYADIGKKENNIALLNYTANQYVLWMTISNLVLKSEIKDLLQRMKSKWYLINYRLYPYVNKVFKFKFLGFGAVRRLLGIYKKIK